MSSGTTSETTPGGTPEVTSETLRKTVFLPSTGFPMRANLPVKELDILAFWKEIGIDRWPQPQEKPDPRPSFALHDGPPYANGHIHIGHAFNKILKDTLNRSRAMAGNRVEFVPGWDCHGLPIEAKVEEAYRAKGILKKDIPPLEFRQACREFAAHWITIQREEFKRLGIRAAWDTPYTTMSPEEETGIVETFCRIFMAGHIYRGLKPVLWSVVEETALAEAEVEYKDVDSPAIDVAFPVIKTPDRRLQGVSVVIWTTTPWSLPGNRAIAYHPDLVYVVLQVDQSKNDTHTGSRFLIGADLVPGFVARCGIEAHTVLATLQGTELQGVVASHPLADHPLAEPSLAESSLAAQGYRFDVPLLPSGHVTADAGTGLVHIAPSHGVDDFVLGQAFGLEVPDTVGPDGIFRPNVPVVAGQHVYKVSPVMIQALESVKKLVCHSRLTHSYPHSWRSKTPLIFRATSQWFMEMDGPGRIREKALDAIDTVAWIPGQGRNRIRAMVEKRPDWCVSRQRVWGVPIPLFIHKKTGQPLKDERVMERVLSRMAQEGTDCWWRLGPEAFVSPFYDPQDYHQVRDILDVWFDSGVTHHFVMKARKLGYPASLYLEGSDQHRGWFQTSLLTACALGQGAPYKAVLTHGFVVDEGGRKMSKSQGNILKPETIAKEKGADILRLWVVSSDCEGDLRIGPDLLKRVEDLYRRIRNTFRYLLSALGEFRHQDRVPYADLPDLEKWVYHQLFLLDEKVKASYDTFQIQPLVQHVHYFCTNGLSAFYFDIRKDALYCEAPRSLLRRAVQTTMADVLDRLVRVLAPLVVFTCEEVWQTMGSAHGDLFVDRPQSVHEASFLPPQDGWKNDALQATYDVLLKVRQVVTGALERAREAGEIGSSLEAHPVVHLEAPLPSLLSADVLAEACITSDLTVSQHSPQDEGSGGFSLPHIPGIVVQIRKAEGQKCGRCWKITPYVSGTPALCPRCAQVVRHHAPCAF